MGPPTTMETVDHHDWPHTPQTFKDRCLNQNSTLLMRLSVEVQTSGQAGFSRAFSTIDHILPLRCLMNQLNPQEKRLYGCFVDFCRTFDAVSREHLQQLQTLKVADYIIRGERGRFNILITPVHILL